MGGASYAPILRRFFESGGWIDPMLHLPAKRTIAIGAAVAVAAAGGGIAFAATSGTSSRSDFLDSVAKHLGISRQKLDDATKAAAIDQVNAAESAGRITKAQADALKKRIASGDVPPLGFGRGFGPGPGGPGFGLGGPGMVKPFIDDGVAAAAKYLGLSDSDLRGKLSNGQSLADVAKAQNKDVNGLQDAIVAAEKADLDKAVANKQLTQAQADKILAALKGHVGDIVNGKLRFRSGPRFAHKGFAFGAGDQLATAAKYLGLSESDLRTKLRNGQSLADVAKAQGKDVNSLQDALVAAQKTKLDGLVAAKKLTQSQADDILSHLKSHVDDLVKANLAAAPRFRGGKPGPPSFFFGP
jgi:predicted XRE-type DNA-binding protein